MNTTIEQRVAERDHVVVQRLKVGYDRMSDSAPEIFALMCKLA